jgi:hypothetical protein
MEFWHFHCLSWDLGLGFKILKFSFLMLKFKKYRVRRFAPSPVLSWKSSRTARDFSSCTVKISRCGVNFMISMQNINKNLQFSLCGNWLRIDCLYSGWRIYCTGRDFYHMGREISRHAGTCPGHVLGKERSGEPYTF